MAEEQSIEVTWGTPLNVLYCPHCHSAHLAPEDVPLKTCPACVQGAVSPEPEHLRRESPELVIPFTVAEDRAAHVLNEWTRGIWLRPGELKADVLLGRMKQYYFPLWLVDSDVQATWQAEMGYDYQAASYREQYDGGQWVSQEVTETRIRWEPRVGRLTRRYDNVAVPAMEKHDLWMSRLGGYDYRTRKAYSARAIARSVVRVPDHDPASAWPDAESALNREAALECQRATEAEHIRNWGMHAAYNNLNWTQMLVPAYVTYYREGEAVFPVWINGQSGRVYGIKLLSQSKAMIASLIIGGFAALLFLLGLLLALVGIGVLFILVALVLGLLAPAPAIWVWVSNRREKAKQ